jgi:hypothetical protein
VTRRNTSPLVEGDTGRNAYLEPNEPGSGLEINRRPFWADMGEEMRWLYAVEECRAFRRSDTFQEHLERIAAKAGQPATQPAAKPMPVVARLPYPEEA